MTLGELQDRMTHEELLIWAAFYEWRSQEEKRLRREAEQKAKARRR